MIKKVTVKWLQNWDACSGELAKGVEWFQKQKTDDPIKLIARLIKEEKWDWVAHCFRNIITKKQAVDWAIYCAEQVINFYEKENPDDKRPREAIEAARKWLKNPTTKNRTAARAAYAARAADAAAYAARAAYAADAADAAAYAADAADAAARAAYAAYAADAAAYAAYAAMRKKCANYMLKKLKEAKND